MDFSAFKIDNFIKKLNLRLFNNSFNGKNNKKIKTNAYSEVNNYYSSNTPQAVSSEEDPYTKGLYTVALGKSQIENCGSFVNFFYKKVSEKRDSGKQTTRNGLTMLNGAIFAIGTKFQNNPEWKEHCASSLREIFHHWSDGQEFTSNFLDEFKISQKQEVKNEFIEFWLMYKYFSGIDHHDASAVMYNAQILLKDQNIKYDACQSEENFISIVKMFFAKIFWMIELSKSNKK